MFGEAYAGLLPAGTRVAVIGAGIAGLMSAALFARAGARVTVYEQAETVCAGASGNIAGSIKPFSGHPADPLTRYYAAAFRFASRCYDTLPAHIFNRCGALDMRGGVKADPARVALPENGAARVMTPAEAERRFHAYRFSDNAVFYEEGGLFYPRELAKALLAGGAFSLKTKMRLLQTAPKPGGGLRLLFAGGGPEEADMLLLCNACDAAPFVPGIPLTPVKGQVTHIRTDTAAGYTAPAHGGGYLLPLPGGDGALIGATFEKGENNADVTAAANAANIARVSAFAPAVTEKTGILSARASVRAVLPDRRPVIGNAATAGVILNAGHGSRGLMTAPFAALLSLYHAAGRPEYPCFRGCGGIADLVSAARFLLRGVVKT